MSDRINDDVLTALSEAYSILLQINVGSRLRSQSAMARCRDAIADLRGVDSQAIQDEFEAKYQPERIYL